MAKEESKIISDMTANLAAAVSENGNTMPENSGPLLQALAKKNVIRIAGPCALQSEEQALAIAEAIKTTTDMMRAPHHKPRTRAFSPDGTRLYNGIGHGTGKSNTEVALPIYEKLNQAGIAVATEIMEPSDVAMLKNAIRLAWVGSRSSVGSLIEAIAQEALTAGLPVMVKNPMFDDFTAFVGMIEAAVAGSKGKVPVMACIRGMFPKNAGEKAQFRNMPNLDWVTRLRESFPDLPIIVDPSHMLLKSEPDPVGKITDILNEAMGRGASGHMVELNLPEFPSVTDPGIPAHAYLEMISKNSQL